MKASVFIATSLDGFIAREDGDLTWLDSVNDVQSSEDYGYAAFMASIDVLVMGRNTFEKVLSFGDWPYAEKHVVVLSHRSIVFPELLTNKIEVSALTPAELLIDLAERGYNHAYIDGGKTIQGFLRSGLINEITISRIPTIIGGGISLFGELACDISLSHLSTQAYESGLVQSKYKVLV